MVEDAKYKASVDGFVQGGMVIVTKVAQASAKRRKVDVKEKGILVRMNTNGVVVDFGSPGKLDEVLLPIAYISVSKAPKQEVGLKKKNKTAAAQMTTEVAVEEIEAVGAKAAASLSADVIQPGTPTKTRGLQRL